MPILPLLPDTAPALTTVPGTTLSTGIPYGILKQTHPSYTEASDTWAELDVLYKGGYTVAKNASKLLPTLVGEQPERYTDRVGCAAYVNYLGQIIDHFVSGVFSHDLTVTEAADADDPNTPGGKADMPYWSMFSADADRRGNSFADVMKCAFRQALLKQRWYVCADLPAPDAVMPSSAADEKAQGLTRGYIYEIPVEQIINWETDDQSGRFKWCVINQSAMRQDGPTAPRNTITETFKLWTRDPATSVIRWDTYAIEYSPDKPPKPEDIAIQKAGGTTTFDQIPILALEVSDAFWVGNKVGPLGKEHFQRRTALVSAEARNLCAIPVYQAGNEVPEVGGGFSANGEDPERGTGFTDRVRNKGYVVVGGNDKIYYAEPSGACYEVIDGQIAGVKDEMFRVVHQMASAVNNNRAAQGRSGDSKKQDRAAEALVLGEFGKICRAFAKKVYDTISSMRKEDVVWTTSGLDSYDAEDRPTLVLEAVQLENIPIPSETFEVEYRAALADKVLPTLNPQTKKTIRAEIVAGVAAKLAAKKVMDDAQQKAALDPKPAVNGKGPLKGGLTMGALPPLESNDPSS